MHSTVKCNINIINAQIGILRATYKGIKKKVELSLFILPTCLKTSWD